MASIKKLNYAPRVQVPADWHAALLGHLKVFDELCSEHGITYSIAFGGLLGAIRHRGFIPWDNDVDVVMDEANYRKLVQLALDGALPQGYAFADRATEDDYTLLFGRFINTNTSCPLGTSAFNGGTHGLFIDVFILFPLPDDPQQQEDAVAAFLVWEQLASAYARRSKYRTPRFFKRWNAVRSYESAHGHDAALAYAEESFRSLIPAFEDATWCLHGSGGAFNGFGRLKTEWFTQPIRVPFEDIELYAPSDPVGFFEQRYGGGWRECPRDRTYKTYSASDLNIPGPVITHDYMQFIDRERALADFRSHTNLCMRESCLLFEAATPRLEAYAYLEAERVNAVFAQDEAVRLFSGDRVADATCDDARLALGRLKPVSDLIFDEELCRWHIVAPLRDDVLAALLWAQFIASPHHWDAQRTAGIYRESRWGDVLPRTPSIERLLRAIDACSLLYRAIDNHDLALLSSAKAVLDALCPQTLHAQTARVYELIGKPGDCLRLISGLPEVMKACDYIQFAYAECLAACGNDAAASEALEALAATTNNAMLMLAINDLSDERGFGIAAAPAIEKKKRAHGASDDRSQGKNEKSLARFGLQGLVAGLSHRPFSQARAARELTELRAEMERYANRIDKYRAIRRVTSERFKTWETMYPRKELVSNAAKTGDPAKIRKVAKAYIAASYRVYDRDGRGLFIDQETLEAAIPVFLHERGQAFVDDFIAKIPEAHREDIDSLLRRNGVDHPYLRADHLSAGS